MTWRPSSGLNFRYQTAERNITPLICAPLSFSVKYRCPVFHSRQLETSPSTQMSPKPVSSRSRIAFVSSETVTTRRCGGAGGAGLRSSSKGSENRSDMVRSAARGRERVDVLRRQVEAFDRSCLATGKVGGDDDGVEAPGAGCRFK